MHCRHHQLHAGVLVLQCDLCYDHSNFNENGIRSSYTKYNDLWTNSCTTVSQGILLLKTKIMIVSGFCEFCAILE